MAKFLRILPLLLLTTFLTAWGLRPELPEQELEQAKSLFYAGRLVQARAKLAHLASSYSQARLPYAACLFALQDYAAAEKVYRDILSAQSDRGRQSTRLWMWLARAQADQGKWQACLQTLDGWPAAAMPPRVMSLRAEALEELGRTREAAFAWKLALATEKRDPATPLVRFEAAQYYEGLGNTLEAEKLYKQAQRLDNSYMAVHRRLASLYLGEGRLADAKSRLERARQVDPKDEEIRAQLSQFMKEQPAMAEADEKARLASEARRHARPTLKVESMQGGPTVRIGLGSKVGGCLFKTGSAMQVFPLAQEDPACLLTTLPAGRVFRVTFHDEAWHLEALPNTSTARKKAFHPLAFDSPIMLKPRSHASTFRVFNVSFGSGYFFGGSEDRSYRGSLEIRPQPKDNRLNVINLVTLEEYLLGVVPSEMPASWPTEALNAQAIVARTDAWGKLGRHASEGFDLCSDVHCAAYRGAGGEEGPTGRAVRATWGKVLVSPAGKLVPALYMNSCGGHTQLPAEAWTKPAAMASKGLSELTDDLPSQLETGQPDMQAKGWTFPLDPQGLLEFIGQTTQAYCLAEGEPLSNFRWVLRYEPSELEAFVNRRAHVGQLKEIQPLARSSSGFVRSLLVSGSVGQAEFTGDQIRSAIKGLKSNLFYVETRRDAKGRPLKFLFHGGGWGHGVGFCQAGSAGRAREGQGSTEILSAYFPDAKVFKRYP